MKKKLFFIVSGPSGSGKTTLVDKLIKEMDFVIRSVSYTTREKRKNEINGKDYFFISEKDFKKKIQKKEFLEHEKVFDHFYGTCKKFIKRQKKHVLLVIDTKGAIKLKKKKIGIFIFIAPPSTVVLKKRLLKRKSETQAQIENRILYAKKELKMIKNYDYKIINDDFKDALFILKSIIIAEIHKIRGNK